MWLIGLFEVIFNALKGTLFILVLIALAIIVFGSFFFLLFLLLFYPICKHTVSKACPRITYKQLRDWYSVNPDSWELYAFCPGYKRNKCSEPEEVTISSFIGWIRYIIFSAKERISEWNSDCMKEQKESTIDMLHVVQRDIDEAMERATAQREQGEKMLKQIPIWREK